MGNTRIEMILFFYSMIMKNVVDTLDIEMSNGEETPISEDINEIYCKLRNRSG